MEDDRKNLKILNVKIVVGTLGRLQSHLKENTLKLYNIKYFIMDEADKLMT
jgi:superfamily II DNA/RNA helicase